MRPRAAPFVMLVLAACGGAGGPVAPAPDPGQDPGPGPGPSPPADGVYAPITVAVQEAVETIPTLTGAAVLLDVGGEVVYERGFGDLGVDDDVLMASVSKLVTTVVVLTLVDEGVLSLDTPIHHHLPEFDDLEMSRVTMRHLLSHTSGLTTFQLCAMEFPDGSRSDDTRSLRLCAAQVAERGPFAEPGTAFRYSNPAFTVAGAVAEVAVTRSWATLFQNRLAGPLGWTRTRWDNGANPPLGGGGWTTAREYARLMRMLADGGVYDGHRILSRALVTEIGRDQNEGVAFEFTPRPPSLHYGLGLWRERVGPGGEALMLSSLGGFGFAAWIDFERDLVGVVVVPDNLGPDHGPVVGRVWGLVEEIVPTVDGDAPGP